MSWDRKRNGKLYYYRSKRQHGRVLKEYIGTGEAAIAVAREDAKRRLSQQLKRDEVAIVVAQVEVAREPVTELCEAATVLTRAVLVASGYYLHRGHEWRIRRLDNG